MALIRATTTSQEIFLELLIHIHTQTNILAHVISNPDQKINTLHVRARVKLV